MRYVLSVFLCVCVCVAPLQAQLNPQAATDARRDAKVDTSGITWLLGGYACNLFAIGFAYLSEPTIPVERLIGKTPDYVETYTVVYKQAAKSERTTMTLVGAGVGLATTILVRYFILPTLGFGEN